MRDVMNVGGGPEHVEQPRLGRQMDPAENFLGPYVPVALIGLIVHGNGCSVNSCGIGGGVVLAG